MNRAVHTPDRASDATINSVYDLICEMETPLTTAIDILGGLALIAETLDGGDEARIIQRLSWLAKDQCKILEDSRGKLFHLAHPRRNQIGGAA